MSLWGIIKDVLLTGTGMVVILSQVLSSRPSDILLVTGLALTVPSVAGHAGALLGKTPAAGPGGGPSSPSSPQPGPLASPPGSEPSGE